jgi:hypothetical protein
MNFINKVQAMCVRRVFGAIVVLVFQKVQIDGLSFNDVIDGLPTDAFVKVFFEGVRPYDIFETRTPITIWHHREDWYLKYNKTYICKLFHIGRNIGSRTNKIFNIVQVETPPGNQLILQNYTNILRIVDGYLETPIERYSETHLDCFWSGSNTRTMILGNFDLYNMFMNDFQLLNKHLQEQIPSVVVFVFDNRAKLNC